MVTAAVTCAIAVAFLVGVVDAPNAAASLVASRTAPYGLAVAVAAVLHATGALLAGTAVAATIAHLVTLPATAEPRAYLAAMVSTVVVTGTMTRLGIPVSASYGLVAGLVAAGLVGGGVSAVNWGHLHGAHPTGVLGIALALAISPVLGVTAGWLLRRGVDGVARYGTSAWVGPARAATWGAAGLVALADGWHDGQKPMGLATGALVAGGAVSTFTVPGWVRGAVAAAMAAGTLLGGRRVIATVGHKFYRLGLLDAVAGQLAGAGVIFGATALGTPISTANTVAAGVVGVGASRRPRHVRWVTVGTVASAWLVTVPACLVIGALVFALLGMLG